MARPSKNNAEYFPHYSGLRNHRKVRVLRNRFGLALGYAFWTMMLEWLIEHDGLEWEYSDMEIEMFASELGVSAAEIRDMVDLCVKLQLLSTTESGFIYSESLNDNLQPVFEKRKRERDRSKDRKRKEDGTFESSTIQAVGVSAAEMPHSKVEYSKVKDTKVSNIGLTYQKKIFKAPTQDEVQSYFKEKNKCSDQASAAFTSKFWSYYENNGWKVGKNKMKDWRLAIASWGETAQQLIEKYPDTVSHGQPKRISLNEKYLKAQVYE